MTTKYQLPQPPVNEEQQLAFNVQLCNYLQVLEDRITALESS